jgi:hypothetical protein
MSLFVKDPTSDKQISQTLKAEELRHSGLPIAGRFLKPQTVIDLAFNATDFGLKVAAASAAEGIKINLNSILDVAYEKLRKQNVRYLETINGKIEFGTYPASVRVNFLMAAGSKELPPMETHAEIMGVSNAIHTGDVALIAFPLTPPLDFTAADNDTLRADVETKLGTFNTAADDWTTKVNTLTERKAICRTLATDVRKEIQFHVSGETEEEMRTYCRTFGVVFEIKKETTEIDVLALFADGSGIASGTTVRIGKLFTDKNKVKKIESVQGATATVNAHGEAILVTTQTGTDLFIIWEKDGCIKGSVSITIIAGEDQSITIHLVKNPPII